METTATTNDPAADDEAAANAWVSNLVADSEAYTRPVFGARASAAEDEAVQTSGADEEGGGGKPDFGDDDDEAEKADAKTVEVRGIKF